MTQSDMLTALKGHMGTSGGGTVEDDVLLRLLLNNAARWVQRECLTKFRRSFLTGTTTFTWTSTQQTKTVPTDFMGILAFWRTDLVDPLIPFQEIDEEEVPYYYSTNYSITQTAYWYGGSWLTGKTPFFFSAHDTISLVRPAQQTITATMRYSALVAALATDGTAASSSFAIPDYTHNAIVWRAVVEAAFGESDMVGEASAYLERELAQVGSVLEAVRAGKHEGVVQCAAGW